MGKSFNISVELQDGNGKKLNAPSTIDILLTITTLPTLNAARDEAAKIKSRTPPGPSVTLDNRRFALAATQRVMHVPALFPKGQGDVDFNMTTHSAGDLRIFVEATGNAQVLTGSSLIIATQQFLRMRKEAAGGIQRIVWQPPPESSTRLKFKDSGLDVVLEGRDLVRPFWVALQDESGRPMLPPSGTAVQVILSVAKGSARFVPQVLTIPPDGAISKEQTSLRSSVGGTVQMAAQSLLASITEAREVFTFELGARATRLDVRPISSSALANGLDAIAVEVKAVYADGGQTRLMTAADENLPNRRVSVSFSGGSARLKGGATELIIAKDDNRGVIEVFSSRQSRKLTLHAESSNGLGQIINGTADIEFSLPWTQLMCAIAGGLLVPLIRRARLVHILMGAVGGALLYILMFFGAVVTGEFSLGKLAVALTKLPTENVFAGFALGVFGYVLISPALRSAPALEARRKRSGTSDRTG